MSFGRGYRNYGCFI